MALNSERSLVLVLLAAISVVGQPFDPADNSPMKIDNRIVSGSDAKLGQFPWQVILKKDAWDDLLCGGSIISDTWVLTAAHCTINRNSIFLMFGTVQLFNPNALNMTSSNIIIHPDYNDKLNNDVSLIQLPEPLTFSDTIRPIQLVGQSADSIDFVGSLATIAGFGYTEDEYLDSSETLLYAQVEIIDNANCVPVFGEYVVVDSTMCAKGFNGSDMSTCSGDSGGPLITYNKTNQQWIQIGINSFVAEDQCTARLPSGYARVSSFLGFIADKTGIVV
ncbi:brachyurin [Drosophila sechellia]|uniref:brachyurin n=1 Tax=Drosophila sechellia TaxID=7238 RepID=UPI0013DDE7EB|nr:brachyurin [Drosophila sechellia]